MRRKNREPSPNSTDTLVGSGSTVEGNISSKAGLRIEGRVVGDVRCEGDVTIGENGRLESNVQARNVFNAGVVEGSIVTRGVLNITATGKVIGDIRVRSLTIAEGGVFLGTSQMAEKPELAETEKDVQAKEKHDRKSHLQKVPKEAVNK